MKIETIAVRVGRDIEAATGEVAPAVHLSTTYERDLDGEFSRGYSYIRPDNPGRRALEQCIAALEGGSDATAYASGSGASLAVFSLLRPGDHVLAPIEVYHGTAKQLRDIIGPMGVSCSFIDMTKNEVVRNALTSKTRLVWIETPSNPMLNISDVETIAELAHGRGAVVCVDNTFATPVWQKPFELGADLVMHSSTKYFGGHSDVMGGAVVARDRGGLSDQLRDYQGTSGNVPSPFDCWLVRRSLTTLSCRVHAQTHTAARLVQFLHKNRAVERVFYPGLETHPGHELARKQMSGFGAMLSFCVRGGRDQAFTVAGRTKLFTRATSLGGVESLIEHRKSVEGPHSVTPENLLRVSVGLENADDLIADLDDALGTSG
ncbi:MAG TPA: aminotransferase class I/II-fold pyridoxal phosphate-dependent enzyme [Steroidobacteraceae bacterium]|nr:aminotransferase class I/II-fold pyridoxal phosphate-dependent enzyme [Steroidobacteraceae bacterium]